MENKKEPTVTVIIPTFNSAATIQKCIDSILKQDYPQKKIDILIVEGGSKDNTRSILNRYKLKIIDTDPKLQNVEYNKSIGIKNATGDLIFLLDHDNILPHKGLLTKMVQPFIDNKNMVGVETLRYHYIKNSTILNRYIALFGVTDPLAFYLRKADRISYIYDEFPKKYNSTDMGGYYLVKFKKNLIPTLGANGFLINRRTLINNAKIKPDEFFHIDVNVDLIRKGYNTYAFVKDSLSHIGGRGSVGNYLYRRMFFMKQFYFKESSKTKSKRRYSLYEKKDFWKLIYFIIIGLTFIVPLIDSVKGYIKLRDNAWFVHPVLCFGFVTIYSYVMIEYFIKNLFKISPAR